MNQGDVSVNDVKRIVRREIGPITRFEPLSSTNNLVYRADIGGNSYVCKVYSDRGVCPDMDGPVIQRLQHPALKRLFYFDDTRKDLPRAFAILEFIEGETYRDMLDGGIFFDYGSHMAQLHELLSEMARIKTSKYGYLNSSFEGSHDDWLEFQLDLHGQTVTRFAKTSNLDPQFYLSVYRCIVERLAKAAPEPVLTPMDLNLNNFMQDRVGRMRIVDVGTYFSGDAFAPYGEFMAHALHTPLWEPFSRLIVGAVDPKNLHLYALITSMSVLSFIAKYVGGDLSEVKPWGNRHTLIELISEHRSALEK